MVTGEGFRDDGEVERKKASLRQIWQFQILVYRQYLRGVFVGDDVGDMVF